MSGYERVKRWREKHHGLANLRQREYRARMTETPVDPPAAKTSVIPAEKATKLDTLRALMAAASLAPVTPVEAPVQIYRDDYGRPITQALWEQLQERKTAAASAGYVIDEYTQ